jgi:diguanylate cyclase (GGDEF)-like protein
VASPAEIEAAVKALHVRPGGSRASYCLVLGEVLRGSSRPLTPGLDYCARGHRFTNLVGSGRTIYANASSSHAQALLALIPVYRGNRIPASAAARSAQFAGWLREIIVPQPLLAIALRGHGAEGVVLSHAAGTSLASFGAGQTGSKALTHAVDLRNGWTATIYTPVAATGVFSYSDATAVLIIGALAAILAGLVIVIPRPRVRVVRAALEPARPTAGVQPGPEDELHDALTGLASMPLTYDRAERMLARVGRQAGMIGGALIVDLDHFGELNERLGAPAGDQLLVTVARRLEEVIRSEDTVGRLEGDRFVILVEAVARGARLDSLARRIIESLRRPVELEGFGPSVNITCSVGVAIGRYTEVDQLLSDAQAAVRSAKDSGRDRYTLFNANVRSVIEDRGVLETELSAALKEDQFFLVYQPICDLRTNEVVSLEALLRWRHPIRGMLGPDQFISVAEQAGLTLPIGRWALEQACARAATWGVAGYRAGVSVMVSTAQLMREGIVTDVQRALHVSGLEPSLLTLEVAESTVMSDVGASAERLAELRSLGVRVAIDDFGNGYAYRSDLQRVPVDFLKVDRTSLAAHEDEDYRNWLFEAILVFARDLSLNVVAKGVETAEQMTNLKAMGCPLAQGFFIGRPLPPEAVEGFLREHVPVTAAADPAWGGPAAAPQTS